MKEEAISKLKKYNQEHILKYDLNNKQQEELEKQIENIDFEQLKSLYESTKEEKCIEEKKIEHIPYTDKTKLTKEEQLSLFEIGEQVIKQGLNQLSDSALVLYNGQSTMKALSRQNDEFHCCKKASSSSVDSRSNVLLRCG